MQAGGGIHGITVIMCTAYSGAITDMLAVLLLTVVYMYLVVL